MDRKMTTEIKVNNTSYQVYMPYLVTDGVRYFSNKHIRMVKLMIDSLGPSDKFVRYGDYTLMVHQDGTCSFNPPYRDFQ